jgi:stress response protein YsnF
VHPRAPRGGTFEAVTVEDANLGRARELFDRGGPAAEEIVIPIVREEMAVGSRDVEAGGIRVTSHVREVPVERTVSIHEEHVTIDRRIVDRPIAAGDAGFRESEFELRGSTDEPVVTKHAHVVEEIHIRKDRQDKITRVEDHIRQTEVELTELPSEPKPGR